MTHADKICPWVTREIANDRPVHKCPLDLVNLLVAIDSPRAVPEEEKSAMDDSSGDEEDDWQRRKYGPTYVVMNRHDVTLT